nr:hypothetical protein [Buttiauxella sp. S19-1]
MTSDELDHLITLKMMGNDEVTENYLNSLQDKYAPAHTGSDQVAESGPGNTGGNQLPAQGPNHTGNNEQVDTGGSHTGNTDGVPNTGGNTTVTPIPDGPNSDDLAYLAAGDKPANLSPDGSANGYTYKNPLYIGHATWALIYNDVAATDPAYQLKYKLIFYKRPEDGNMFSAFTVAECSPAPVEAKLSDWRANNYARVTAETEKYMSSCLLELNNQLPRLLKK